MIKLRLAPYVDTTWRWDGVGYSTTDHGSDVVPYRHPMLESLAVTDGARTLMASRERIAGRPACGPMPRRVTAEDYDRARSLAVEWPADYVLVETTSGGPVRVTAGACGIAPVYLAHEAGTLYGSWDMADLRRHAAGINPREAARLLIYRPRYTTETLFHGIWRLTERATAYYGDNLYIRYPEPALHSGPRELAPGADVLGAFMNAMDNAVDLRPLDPAVTVLHLTGGLDSGTVATRMAQRFPDQYRTAALLIGGPGRGQQIRRRREMRAVLPFLSHDTLVDAMNDAPLHRDCARVRGELISPYEEPLHHPFARLTQAIAAHGARIVVTGLGGDEMVALSQDEYPHPAMGDLTSAPPWVAGSAIGALEYADDGIAPPAVVNSMTLLSLETTAPPLLRAGVWPVHPFTDPGMVKLGEQLPMHWRDLKQLQRRQLGSLGLSDDVTQPAERESFAEVVQHALTTHAAPLFARMLLDGSTLFDAGLVDPDQLQKTVMRLGDGEYDEDTDAQLLEVIDLHLATCAFL